MSDVNLLAQAHELTLPHATLFNDYSDKARQSRFYLKYLALWAAVAHSFRELRIIGDMPEKLSIGVIMVYEQIYSNSELLYTNAAFDTVDSGIKYVSAMEAMWLRTGFTHGVLFWLDDTPKTTFVTRRCTRCRSYANLKHIELQTWQSPFSYVCDTCWDNSRVLPNLPVDQGELL